MKPKEQFIVYQKAYNLALDVVKKIIFITFILEIKYLNQ